MEIAFDITFYLGMLTIIFPVASMLYFQTIEQIFILTLIIGIATTLFAKLMAKKIEAKKKL